MALSIYQENIDIVEGREYNLFCRVNINGIEGSEIGIYQGTQLVFTVAYPFPLIEVWENFIADGSGNKLTFLANASTISATVDVVSLRETLIIPDPPSLPVKEFLTGTTDEGQPIFFRADTPLIQLTDQFETFSNPLAVINRTQRGTLMKTFVALDDGDFYEIEGTISKGVSIQKVHSENRRNKPSPPNARKMRVSWRDGSKQLCRLIQSAIVFTPGTMDYSE